MEHVIALAASIDPARRAPPGSWSREIRPAGAPRPNDRRGLEQACRTLLTGADFVGTNAAVSADPLVLARMLGNRLRELDRFLGLAADEAAQCLGLGGGEQRAFARLHNSANKLRTVRAMLQLDSPDHATLCAVGRVRQCLHHCGGRLHSDAAWRRLSGARRLLGVECALPTAGAAGTLILPVLALTNISRLYQRAGSDLLARIHGRD